MIALRTETNLAAFNSTLAHYMSATNKTADEVLEKKGRDLGIRLYQLFSEHKFGGAGKKRAGIAKSQLATRTSAGVGTHVRKSLLAEYFSKRAQLRSETAETFGPHNASSQRAADRFATRSIKKRIRLWQSIVGREIAIRQRGIGVLGASFLWFRSRTSQAKGVTYVRNKTGRALGAVEKGDGFLRIVGFTEGLSLVDQRYGIVSRALNEANADMVAYVTKKINELTRSAERFAA